MRRDQTGRGLIGAAAIVCLAIAPASGQSGEATSDDTSGAKQSTPRTPPGAGGASTRRPGSSQAPSNTSARSSSGQGSGGAATRTTTSARTQPTTTNPRLRDRLYNNVRPPGGTYSTEPLSPEQDLDQPLQEPDLTSDEFEILGSEDFDGFTAYAVNNADLFLDTLTDAQRRSVRVIRAGEIGNEYDLILVDDAIGFDIQLSTGDPMYGAGAAYYERNFPYYTTPSYSRWWGVYSLGYPSAHAANWGFSYGYGYGYSGYGHGYGYSDRYYASPYGYYYNRYDNGYRRYWGPIDSSYSGAYQSNQTQAQGDDAQPAVEMTTLELARVLLRGGRVEEAIKLYQEHLKDDPEDTVAMRTLGAALIEAGQVSEGFAMIRLAYGADPALAGEAMDARLFESSSRLREIVRKAVRAANKEESSSGWLAVVMLMQSEGRDRVALKNLVKAERQYLSDDIARAMRQRLE